LSFIGDAKPDALLMSFQRRFVKEERHWNGIPPTARFSFIAR
jgi:hypothetical protein